MINIGLYRSLICSIPVKNQSSNVKLETCINKKLIDQNNQSYFDDIFKGSDEIAISRNDVFSERVLEKKIIMLLLWGYPSGGRGNNLKNLLININSLVVLFGNCKNKINKKEYNELVGKFKKVRGLGPSTWSKFLYFFDFSVDGFKCQILDDQILKSFKKQQFHEFSSGVSIRQSGVGYYSYINFLDGVSSGLGCSSEQIELFLFYYNNNYKFV